jgi:hypothetical protein
MTCRIKEYKVTKYVHVRGANPFSKTHSLPREGTGGWSAGVSRGCCVRLTEASAGGWDVGGGVGTGEKGMSLGIASFDPPLPQRVSQLRKEA